MHSVFCVGVKLGLRRKLRVPEDSAEEKIPGDWRKLRNEELHNLYSSSKIIRLIKSSSTCG
jgi:hypothetical protein